MDTNQYVAIDDKLATVDLMTDLQSSECLSDSKPVCHVLKIMEKITQQE